MSHLLPLALRSAWNRRHTLGLTLLSIVLAVTLLLGIERVRQDARAGFAHSVSGTDLVVGARASPIQLILHAVFRIGETTHDMSWEAARMLAERPEVAWTIPLALGDSHLGYPVVGTSADYFVHFRHGDRKPLRFAEGRAFEALFEAVLGAEVAQRLNYRLGDRITLTHGGGGFTGAEHDDKPFTVVGVLARTGTPVDRSVHISLQAMAAIHLDWQGGAPIPGFSIPAELVGKFDLTPKSVTAVLVGLHDRAAVFALQRELDGYRAEPLMAVLPGVALSQLWDLLAVAERALLAMSTLVVAVGLAGMVAVVLAGLGERRRELAILRSVGARPRDLFALLALEGFAVTLLGALLGLLLVTVLAAGLGPWLQASYGIAPTHAGPTAQEWQWLGWVLAVGTLASLLPGYRAYRLSLADGLTPRI